MRVLMHICCAPCAIFPLAALRAEGFLVAGYFFNPNIHPYREYARRRETLQSYSVAVSLDVAYDDSYDLEGFLRATVDKGRDRCITCYSLRLEKTFVAAVEKKAEAVTTTLLYSRYQRHEHIASIGESLSKAYDLPFLYRDFRRGWSEGVGESKKMGLYRQPYCGCVFSERDRFKDR